MSTTNKNNEGDNQQDKSSVLSLLQSIETIYNTCQQVLNTHTQTALVLSITIEAQMLLTKLRVMKARWTRHLPFKEACNVDFYDWAKKLDKMCQSFDFFRTEGKKGGLLPGYCPSKHFLLDLYEMLPEAANTQGHKPYYEDVKVRTFIETQDGMRIQLRKQWDDYKEKFSDVIAYKVDELVGEVMSPLMGKGMAVHMACHEVLRQLSHELNQLDEISSSYIKPEQFARLAERVIYEPGYGGEKARRAAHHYVANLRNTTPEDEWETKRKEEILASIDSINSMKYGRRVSSYLARNYDLLGHYAGFGKFLNSFRKDISKEELYDLMVQLYRIHYFREDKGEQDAILSENLAESIVPTSIVPQAMSSPQRPKLPIFFTKALITDANAIKSFYDILHHCGNYVGRKLTASEKQDDTIVAEVMDEFRRCVIKKEKEDRKN